MVPERLQLRNFMCYGEDLPALEFAGLHVACISGDNGAGKSTLLDSLTWALWGRARGKSDDDLIRLGYDEMEAVFEFAVDSQRYRVVRRRKRGKRQGTTTLDFQIAEAGDWRGLSGDTINDTQAAINRVLRLEYDTFINSAFLLQGRADEFTGRKPAERKQVLADILGLAEYEALEQRAKDQSTRLTKQLDLETASIERLQVEVLRHDELIEALNGAREHEASVQSEVDDNRAAMHELQAEANRLHAIKAQRDALSSELESKEQTRREQDIRVGELRTQLQTLEAVLARGAEIEQGNQALEHARATLDELDQRREEALQLNEQFKHFQALLDKLKSELEGDLRLATERLAEVDTRLEQREQLREERRRLAEALRGAEQLREEQERLHAQERELGERRARLLELSVQAAQLQGEIKVARDSLIGSQNQSQQRIAALEPQASGIGELERRLAQAGVELERLAELDAELADGRADEQRLIGRRGELEVEYRTVEASGIELKEKLRLIESGDGACPVCGSPLGADGATHIGDEYTAQLRTLRTRISGVKHEQRELAAALADRKDALARLEAELGQRPRIEAAAARLQLQRDTALTARAELDDAVQTLDTIQQQLAGFDYARQQQRELQRLTGEMEALGTLDELGAALADARAQYQAAVQRAEQYREQRDEWHRVEAELKALDGVQAQRPALLTRWQALDDKLKRDDYGADHRREQAAVKAAGTALGYDREAHLALRQDEVELRHWERELNELHNAQGGIERTRGELERETGRAAATALALERQREQLAALDGQLVDQPDVEFGLQETQRRDRELQPQLAVAHRRSAGAEKELQACEQAMQALEQHQSTAGRLVDERGVYDELAQAFGKKGVQAMLIETAIPELETEANELLARMTDNQFHLAFETQRDTKRGDATIETLDIRISDALGTRDYAMFSGGEAFRINFAVRIALSKLLARRAGASLKTLVLDEGFGSQDGQGRDRVVEAINSIESDFERILVITHIEELKDAFGTRIEIAKTPDGSVWSIA